MTTPRVGQVWRYKNSEHASDREIVLVHDDAR